MNEEDSLPTRKEPNTPKHQEPQGKDVSAALSLFPLDTPVRDARIVIESTRHPHYLVAQKHNISDRQVRNIISKHKRAYHWLIAMKEELAANLASSSEIALLERVEEAIMLGETKSPGIKIESVKDLSFAISGVTQLSKAKILQNIDNRENKTPPAALLSELGEIVAPE